MSKLKINERLIIRCYDHEQVKDVLDKLTDLGYKTEFQEEYGNIISFEKYKKSYINTDFVALDEKSIVVRYKRFIKIYERQKEKLKKEPDLLIDKNKKILKVNDIDKTYHVFYYDNNLNRNYGIDFKGLFLAEDINKIDFYTSLEALEKALKRKEIENKLRLLAFKLNGNKDIDWDNEKWKYFIYYDSKNNSIETDSILIVKDMNIYCSSENFKDKAIELIGKEELKEYLINS